MSVRASATEPEAQRDRDSGWVATESLRPVPPFDFSHSLAFIRSFAPTAPELLATLTSLTKAFLVNGHAVAARITATGASTTPALALAMRADAAITPEVQATISDRLRFYLSLDDDLSQVYAIGREDSAFASLMVQLHGYHQVKFPTPFENAAWAILSQRTRLPAAHRTKQGLTEAFCRSITVTGTTLWAFPAPAAIAAAPAAALAQLIHNDRKAAYLKAAAAAFADADESFLRHGRSEEVAAWLRGIPGIGPWSASFVLIRGLGRMNVGAVESKLEQAAARWYGPLPAAKLAAIARRYGPWQGYWAHYRRVAHDRLSATGNGAM